MVMKNNQTAGIYIILCDVYDVYGLRGKSDPAICGVEMEKCGTEHSAELLSLLGEACIQFSCYRHDKI